MVYAKKSTKPRKPYTRRNYSKIRGHGAYNTRPYGRTYMRGRGSYFSDMYNRARAATKGWAPVAGGFLGDVAGGLIAPGVGGPLGREIGKNLGTAYSKITGWGDYEIKSNSIVNPSTPIPSFGTDSIRIRKTEMLMHLDATTSFNNNFIPLNPGLDTSFPWLSRVAANYSQYKWLGLVFTYKSTSSVAIASSTNLALGSVIMATNYNAVEPAFVNDIQMLNYMYSNAGRPSETIVHGIECAPGEQQEHLYNIRTGDVPTGADPRLYDMGNFQIATLDSQGTYQGGQLWVSYDILLCKSVMNNQIGYDINTDIYELSAPSTTEPFGGAVLKSGSNLGTTISNPVSGTSTISFPPSMESGYYLIRYNVTGTTPAAFTYTTSYNNAAYAGDNISNGGDTTNNGIGSFIVEITSRDAAVNVLAANLPTGTVSGLLIITQVNGQIYV